MTGIEILSALHDTYDDIVDAFFSSLTVDERYAHYKEQGYNSDVVGLATDKNEADCYSTWIKEQI